jgi:sugar (pentulose or hexulose) kinase
VLTDLLPKVRRPGAAVGPIAPTVADRLGLPPAVMVRAGTTDSIGAFLAAGATAPGEAVTSLGTTLVVKLVSDVRVNDPARGIYSHRLNGRWLAGGASNTGGGALLSVFPAGAIARLSAAMDPKTDTGLDYYPLARPGERFPVADPALQPRMTPRPENDTLYLQGLLEGIARIESDCYAALANLGAPMPVRILTAGGGAANAEWTAIRRRILGVDVLVAPQTEAAVGMALLCRDAHSRG